MLLEFAMTLNFLIKFISVYGQYSVDVKVENTVTYRTILGIKLNCFINPSVVLNFGHVLYICWN